MHVVGEHRIAVERLDTLDNVTVMQVLDVLASQAIK